MEQPCSGSEAYESDFCESLSGDKAHDAILRRFFGHKKVSPLPSNKGLLLQSLPLQSQFYASATAQCAGNEIHHAMLDSDGRWKKHVRVPRLVDRLKASTVVFRHENALDRVDAETLETLGEVPARTRYLDRILLKLKRQRTAHYVHSDDFQRDKAFLITTFPGFDDAPEEGDAPKKEKERQEDRRRIEIRRYLQATRSAVTDYDAEIAADPKRDAFRADCRHRLPFWYLQPNQD